LARAEPRAGEAIWEKPQGKNPPLVLKKHFEIVGRGVALVVGCGTFPTWNTYPGLFAALATGNAVIVNAVRQPQRHPAGWRCRCASIREVLVENGIGRQSGFPGGVCRRCRRPTEAGAPTRPSGRSTSPAARPSATVAPRPTVARPRSMPNWPASTTSSSIRRMPTRRMLRQPGVHALALFGTDVHHFASAIFIPAAGIATDRRATRASTTSAGDLARAVTGFLSKPEVAHAVLGAIQSAATLQRIDEAASGKHGAVVLAPQKLENPDFPNAEVRTPVLLACDAGDEAAYMEERFGPIAFIVKVADTAAAIALSERIVATHGALTAGVYSTRPEVIEAMTAATWRSKVALSINLTGGVFVNQSAAYSDYHGTGGNPAANASYADSAFVANRFRVVQRRHHI
jgi:hypothetical protein